MKNLSNSTSFMIFFFFYLVFGILFAVLVVVFNDGFLLCSAIIILAAGLSVLTMIITQSVNNKEPLESTKSRKTEKTAKGLQYMVGCSLTTVEEIALSSQGWTRAGNMSGNLRRHILIAESGIRYLQAVGLVSGRAQDIVYRYHGSVKQWVEDMTD